MMKKLVALFAAALLLLSCAALAEEGWLQLGTSNLSVCAPGYVPGEMTEADLADDQVGYFYSEDSAVDFDVYQWAKEGQTLEAYAAEEADGKELSQSEVNGLSVYMYNDEEESEGVTYKTMTCITEDGDDFVEIVFWLDGENAQAEAEAILGTLTANK